MVARILLVGNVEPQAGAALRALESAPVQVCYWFNGEAPRSYLTPLARAEQPDLIVVAGWRYLIPPDVLAIAPCVGFHSAKLPEYPGRAPVPWTLLRGDTHAWNTMLHLDEGVDSGDIIDTRRRRIRPDDTPATLYEWMAATAVEMLLANLPGLLDGTAPRHRQDMARRGPLTTADGWQRWEARCASS